MGCWRSSPGLLAFYVALYNPLRPQLSGLHSVSIDVGHRKACEGHGFCALGNVGGISFWVKEEVAEITSCRPPVPPSEEAGDVASSGPREADAVLVIHKRCVCVKYNIDNSNIIYTNKHRLIKKK